MCTSSVHAAAVLPALSDLLSESMDLVALQKLCYPLADAVVLPATAVFPFMFNSTDPEQV